MVTHQARIKSIHTPPRRDKISPSKRAKRDDEGPTPFTLQRQAETIGARTVCMLDGKGTIRMAKTVKAGNTTEEIISKDFTSQAEFASSSALARILTESGITYEQYRAGTNYTRLHRLIWGSTQARQSSLSKVMATSMEDRIHQANKKAREERDDEDYAEWIAAQRGELEAGESALAHIVIPLPPRTKASHAIIMRERAHIRLIVRQVCLENQYKHRGPLLSGLRTGLEALREAWSIT